jgi:hypothetical protein
MDPILCSYADIDRTIKSVSSQYYGFGGNCADFAFVLNRVFGGDGSYLIVDGGHYECADHILVNIRGRLFDADGMTKRADVIKKWCGDGEKLETFYDPSITGHAVRRLAGEGMVARLDIENLEDSLREASNSIVKQSSIHSGPR